MGLQVVVGAVPVAVLDRQLCGHVRPVKRHLERIERPGGGAIKDALHGGALVLADLMRRPDQGALGCNLIRTGMILRDPFRDGLEI